VAERWNGSTWTIQLTAEPTGSVTTEFFGVSCTSADACTAVGDYTTKSSNDQTLAERWNGTSWSAQATPDQQPSTQNEFEAVACPSASTCTAVGYYFGKVDFLPLAAGWNGTAWARLTPVITSGARTSQLSDVSCPTVRSCEAVGSYFSHGPVNSALAEGWNGSAWAIQAVPDPAGSADSYLQGVSCPAARDCVAVGDYYPHGASSTVPLAEAWNGSTWAILTVPAPSGGHQSRLDGVSCTSADACTAVGVYTVKSGSQVALAERWNGKSWTIQTLPHVAGNTSFAAVSCSAAGACQAVGTSTTSSAESPLAESWNGTAWTVHEAPLPADAGGGYFAGVSCTCPDACTATGSYLVEQGGLTLADRWNGKSWQLESIPNPPHASESVSDVTVQSVSCVSAKSCFAIGNYLPDQVPIPFAETWNGSSWSLQAISTPYGAAGRGLGGVSCDVTRCTAVGNYFQPSQVEVTLAVGRAAG
jgi:hypothetical protein